MLDKKYYLRTLQVGVGDVFGLISQVITLGRGRHGQRGGDAAEAAEAIVDLLGEVTGLFEDGIPNIHESRSWQEIGDWDMAPLGDGGAGSWSDMRAFHYPAGRYLPCRCGWKRQQENERSCCGWITGNTWRETKWVDTGDPMEYTYGIYIYRNNGRSASDWTCSCEWFGPNGGQAVSDAELARYQQAAEQFAETESERNEENN